ncbi:MAG: hypothetical protein M1820_004736 [Bogoriella megaspora]|nr:MAG: hypothetical protein M1820_004736 [Bogoriella megaspora]
MATQRTIELQPLPQTSQSLKTLSATVNNSQAGIPLGSPPVGLIDTNGPEASNPSSKILPKTRAAIVIAQISGISFLNSFCNGLIIIGLPTLASDLHLASNLLVWPSSIAALTSGSCLLLAGSVADVIGTRIVNLVGCFMLSLCVLATGLSRNGAELVVFRALTGIASALYLPTGVSIISTSIKSGRPRNVGFACTGLAMPLGFSFGLVLGGVFVSSAGWRTGWYIAGAASFLLGVVGVWTLPPNVRTPSETSMVKRLVMEIDWVGALMASTCLATFSYVLAMLSADVKNIHKATNIVLLTLSLVLVPTFVCWMHRQEKIRKPALIPNSLWKNSAFVSVNVVMLLSNAVVNGMELFSSLFFQEVQRNSAIGASLRILPSAVFGTFLNLTTGLFINRISAAYALAISSLLSTGAPLLMALINPAWPYWYDAFFAQLLFPLSSDVLFTIGLLVVSDVFPERDQALAGAVFNTVSMLGTSVGLTCMSVISAAVTDASNFGDKASPEALMSGYRASFWTLFAWMVTAGVIGGLGLRRVGKVGVKRD